MSVNLWNRDQVTKLIESYRNEKCLYVIHSPNYHNKHLRAEAMRRVCAAVTEVRPNTTEKECVTKFHSLRNQFHVENAKVKASVRSGVGTGNIYKPNLWYFDKIRFLEEHYVPRKSRSSSFQKQCEDTERREVVEESYFTEEGTFNVFLEDSEYDELDVTQLPSPTLPSTPDVSQIQATTSRSAETQSTPLKRKKGKDGDDAYVGALASIADSLKKPIPVANPTTCTVDSCMMFLGSMLKEIKSEKLKLETMSDLVQTVINARSIDLAMDNN